MTDKTIRAWKDPKFRAELSADERRDLPDNPAGRPLEEADPDELDDVAGGSDLPTDSGGNVCTLTTECPILSVCCSASAT